MNVLVVGGAGYIGTHILATLSAQGLRVALKLDRDPTGSSSRRPGHPVHRARTTARQARRPTAMPDARPRSSEPACSAAP